MAGRTPDGDPALFLRVVLKLCRQSECVIWPYGRDTKGYALIWRGGHMVLVSRIVCEHFHGPAPTPKHEAAHSCNRGHEGCINFRHLRWATRQENQADRILAGGDAKMKLTPDKVRLIRAKLKAGEAQKEIAHEFDVSQRTISDIKTGRRWKAVR